MPFVHGDCVNPGAHVSTATIAQLRKGILSCVFKNHSCICEERDKGRTESYHLADKNGKVTILSKQGRAFTLLIWPKEQLSEVGFQSQGPQ